MPHRSFWILSVGEKKTSVGNTSQKTLELMPSTLPERLPLSSLVRPSGRKLLSGLYRLLPGIHGGTLVFNDRGVPSLSILFISVADFVKYRFHLFNGPFFWKIGPAWRTKRDSILLSSSVSSFIMIILAATPLVLSCTRQKYLHEASSLTNFSKISLQGKFIPTHNRPLYLFVNADPFNVLSKSQVQGNAESRLQVDVNHSSLLNRPSSSGINPLEDNHRHLRASLFDFAWSTGIYAREKTYYCTVPGKRS
ncbi:hypothetical protein CC1G_03301 [Coprinopsis cinerea okayama7|uniref:Uncharacterized protein n=1 Tax=Coprinopsis cinerea (strain Okayama-7 / 130 / ATCC MYA-4618 / FGSC 9003) TaxID=240176 RepID=A8N7F8_COPC7|nr:hypothetical protein CC1G_03301 [Coprinopsis cinerea okayama7\|eukprot:XP_001830764.2 hypothetical protein CC1G_03301 [Coprinopsis cinerea okayama7\